MKRTARTRKTRRMGRRVVRRRRPPLPRIGAHRLPQAMVVTAVRATATAALAIMEAEEEAAAAVTDTMVMAIVVMGAAAVAAAEEEEAAAEGVAVEGVAAAAALVAALALGRAALALGVAMLPQSRVLLCMRPGIGSCMRSRIKTALVALHRIGAPTPAGRPPRPTSTA